MTTPYEAIGGPEPVRAILRSLYERLARDPIVGFLFEGRDLERIVAQQLVFTCALLGGPERYEGTPLPQAHAALPLLAGHFDRRHFLLARVLEEHAVPEEVRRVWLAVDENLRGSVLSAGEAARALTRRA